MAWGVNKWLELAFLAAAAVICSGCSSAAQNTGSTVLEERLVETKKKPVKSSLASKHLKNPVLTEVFGLEYVVQTKEQGVADFMVFLQNIFKTKDISNTYLDHALWTYEAPGLVSFNLDFAGPYVCDQVLNDFGLEEEIVGTELFPVYLGSFDSIKNYSITNRARPWIYAIDDLVQEQGKSTMFKLSEAYILMGRNNSQIGRVEAFHAYLALENALAKMPDLVHSKVPAPFKSEWMKLHELKIDPALYSTYYGFFEKVLDSADPSEPQIIPGC
ncbi:hypothetical protein HN587_02185 [Candidatus Woesearchaeota archaeon]|nr:hypothetical protein [Candidatus Woesearchaeota archaeon]